MNAAIHRRLTIIENKLRKCCGEELLTVTGELSSPVETATPMVTPIFATPPLKKKNKKKGKSKKAKKTKGGAAKSRKMKGG